MRFLLPLAALLLSGCGSEQTEVSPLIEDAPVSGCDTSDVPSQICEGESDGEVSTYTEVPAE